jgi:hypothetical protein
MTREDALRLIMDARRAAVRHYEADATGSSLDEWWDRELATAILAAVAEERERWIKLAPWWTGRALQSPEDIRRLAVAEERERCAGIADAAARLATSGPPLVYVTAQQFAADLAKDIADGVRQGLPAPNRQTEPEGHSR